MSINGIFRLFIQEISSNVAPVAEPAKQVAEGQAAVGSAAQTALLY
jgi:hypothetical protein